MPTRHATAFRPWAAKTKPSVREARGRVSEAGPPTLHNLASCPEGAAPALGTLSLYLDGNVWRTSTGLAALWGSPPNPELLADSAAFQKRAAIFTPLNERVR